VNRRPERGPRRGKGVTTQPAPATSTIEVAPPARPSMNPAELAALAARLAEEVESVVFDQKKRMDRLVTESIGSRRSLAPSERASLRRAALAICRWHGWVSRLGLESIEGRLLVSTLLDEREVSDVAKAWARRAGVDSSRLFALGDAPDWGARAQGLRRMLNNSRVATDPWLLFPSWLKDSLPEPPGEDAPKHKLVRFLAMLQSPNPTWVRARGERPDLQWNLLKEAGSKPWVVRGMPDAARIDGVLPHRVTPGGDLEIEDIASQLVVRACDPEPGERWWVVHAGSGEKALHLADRMKGKGTVVVTDSPQTSRLALIDRFRRAGRSNLMPRDWDGRHVPGKSGTYHGVLVEPLSSALGAWRRHPDARWLVTDKDVDAFVEQQLETLGRVAKGVRPGGTLVYAVRTLTKRETSGVIEQFGESHPDFRPDPFPKPPWQTGPATRPTLLLWPATALDLEPTFIARWQRVT
jgi:16S rRNA (cytosine967-C5)-methyltransferase